MSLDKIEAREGRRGYHELAVGSDEDFVRSLEHLRLFQSLRLSTHHGVQGVAVIDGDPDRAISTLLRLARFAVEVRREARSRPNAPLGASVNAVEARLRRAD